MKKLLLTLALALGLSVATHAGTATYYDEDFINNGSFVCLTNGQTYTFWGPMIFTNSAGAATGIYGTNIWYYSYLSFTNVLTGTTNGLGQTPSQLAGAFTDVGLWPDANGNQDTNFAISATFGITNNTLNQGVMSPVNQNTVWTNPVPYYTALAGSIGTNPITFTFAPVSDLRAQAADNLGGRTFTWSPNLVGSNLPVTLSFYPTSGVLVGAKKLRLVSIFVQTNLVSGSQGIILNSLHLQGWGP